MSPSLLNNFTFKNYIRILKPHEFLILLFSVLPMVIEECFKFGLHNSSIYVYAKMQVFLIV